MYRCILLVSLQLHINPEGGYCKYTISGICIAGCYPWILQVIAAASDDMERETAYKPVRNIRRERSKSDMAARNEKQSTGKEIDKQTMPNLADRSREIRTQLGLSQNDVAKALHVTRGFISNVENGRVNMSMRLMVYYARLMHVSLDEIVGLTDKQYLSTALDHEIMEEISQLSLEEKNDLLNQLKTGKKKKADE